MSLSKSFSISASGSLVSLLLTGCISQSSGIYRQVEAEPFREVQSYFTPHDKSLMPIIGDRDPMTADPRRVFEYYCSGGRSQRPLETTIRAVLPRAPKGVAIDAASSLQQELYEYFRLFAKNYYKASIYEDDSRNQKLSGSPLAYAMKEPSMESCVALAKETRVNEKVPFTLLSVNGTNTLLLGAMRMPIYSRSSYSGSEAGLFQWRKASGEPPQHNSIDVIFPSRPMFDDQGQKIYPVYPTLPFEVLFFQKYFTMLIPAETQQQLFQGNTFFLRDDGSFDLGKATQRRAAVWEAYVGTQTSLKEAQSDDPQIVDFQVKLDLNLFCRYGRVVSDLLTD